MVNEKFEWILFALGIIISMQTLHMGVTLFLLGRLSRISDKVSAVIQKIGGINNGS